MSLKDLPDNPGVYLIRNVWSGKVYVGSSIHSVKVRLHNHRNQLVLGKHDNSYLQRAWVKYGPEAFMFTVIELCGSELCIEREQYWLDELKAAQSDYGYNLRPKAENMEGYRHTKESKIHISERTKERMKDPEIAERVRKGHEKRKANPQLGSIIRAGWKKVDKEKAAKSFSEGQKKRFKDPNQIKLYAKLTEEQVREIRRLYKWRDPEFGSTGLAKKYKMSQYAVMCIIHRKTWRYLED